MKKIYSRGKHARFLLKKSRSSPPTKRHYFSRNRYKVGSSAYFNNTDEKKKKGDLGTVKSPAKLNLFENSKTTLSFIREVRTLAQNYKKINKEKITMNLRPLRKIDYSTSCILTAINEELKSNKIQLVTKMPRDPSCSQYLRDSGYLDNLFDNAGRRKTLSTTGRHVLFEMGAGPITQEQRKQISLTVEEGFHRIGLTKSDTKRVKTIILELCANSIEWGKSQRKNWVLGVKMEDNKIIFTLTDVGIGILDSLNKKWYDNLDFLKLMAPHKKLGRAFDQKYGSSSGDINRNRGLPYVKQSYVDGKIGELRVLTNNVFLDFDNPDRSKTFNKGHSRFRGTAYIWTVTRDNVI